MGRAERRRMERNNRLENRKDKVLMSQKEVNNLKRRIIEDVADFKVETMMTCFALALHRVFRFGPKRILRLLQYIDDLMGAINTGEKTIDDYRKELEEEAKVVVSCK